MTDQEKEHVAKMISDFIEKVLEHVDSVQVFCTAADTDGTANFSKGGGNWFARYGQIRNWVETCEADSFLQRAAQGDE